VKIEIEDYGMNAEGVGKIDGKVVLVANALVGEIVDCSIEKDFGNYATAKINEIVKPSNNRVDEKCEHCKVCGGCNLMHMNYDEQLKFKQTLVKKTIKKIAKIDIDVSETVGSKQFNYRNKMSFSVGSGNCGLKGRSSDDIFNIDTCSLTSETINIILNLFKQSGFAYNENVKNLVVRELSNQVLVGVVVKRELDLTKFFNALKQINREIGLFQVVNQMIHY
jgi:23S rRNA (uracil1939-C5)-methyltransferase